MARFITTFRSLTNPLQWDFHVSENEHEAVQVAFNLKCRGVKDYVTHELGPQVAGFSSMIGETNDGE